MKSSLIHTAWTSIEVTHKKVREFGLVIFIVVGLIIPVFIAYKNGWEVTSVAVNLFGGSAVFFLFCLIVPRLLYKVYKGWMLIALGLGFVVTRFIISLVYILLMTPIGFIRRQKKGSLYRTFLDFEPDKHDSYWIRREEAYKPEQTERQF